MPIQPEPPQTMRWCVGEAGLLFEQALIAMRGILEAAGESHWQHWIETDLARWNGDGDTEHHRSAYGGMGSFNDLYLDDGDAGIWLDAALRSCQHVASSVASAAQDDASTFRQVSPGSNRGSGGVRAYVCESCHAQFVTPADQVRAAAFAWASAVLPQLLQSGAGRSAAEEALGQVDPDGRALYVNFVARAVATAGATETDFDSFAEWRCPSCGDRAWRASWAPAF